jgi:hypothetical protein
MRSNVKPFTYWVIARGYKVRFQHRDPQRVTGILTTPQGEVAFDYDPQQRIITWPAGRLTLNEYGWEINQTAST